MTKPLFWKRIRAQTFSTYRQSHRWFRRVWVRWPRRTHCRAPHSYRAIHRSSTSIRMTWHRSNMPISMTSSYRMARKLATKRIWCDRMRLQPLRNIQSWSHRHWRIWTFHWQRRWNRRHRRSQPQLPPHIYTIAVCRSQRTKMTMARNYSRAVIAARNIAGNRRCVATRTMSAATKSHPINVHIVHTRQSNAAIWACMCASIMLTCRNWRANARKKTKTTHFAHSWNGIMKMNL